MENVMTTIKPHFEKINVYKQMYNGYNFGSALNDKNVLEHQSMHWVTNKQWC